MEKATNVIRPTLVDVVSFDMEQKCAPNLNTSTFHHVKLDRHVRNMLFMNPRARLHLDEVEYVASSSCKDIHADPDTVERKSRLINGGDGPIRKGLYGLRYGLGVEVVLFLN